MAHTIFNPTDALDPNIDWDSGGRVHNWKNHVGENVRALWNTLSDEVRLAIAHDAEVKAGNEEWE